MDVSAAAAAVLAVIVGAPEAWARRDGIDAGGLEELEAAGWVEAWERPDFRAVTLTPWGAWSLGVDTDERFRPAVQEVESRDPRRPLAPAEVRAVSVFEEVPYWVASNPEAPAWAHAIVLPPPSRCGASLTLPDLVPDHRPGPEVALDDSGEPIVLLKVPVVIDRRLRGKSA